MFQGTWGVIVAPPWDYIDLNPPAKPTTITFKVGGSGGEAVAIYVITYSSDDVATVTRTL